MNNISINKNLSTPLYIQLANNIKLLIENDTLQMEKLPSIRVLSKHLQVNNVTVVNGYKLLEQEGYVYSVKGSGTYIKKNTYIENSHFVEEGDLELMLSGILPISRDSINFASISPTADLFPIEEFKKALVEVLDRDKGSAFLYPEVTGYRPLKQSISKFLMNNYNTHVNEDQILITSGGQQGLDIISKTLINPGDCILVENPTYSGAIAVFQSRGAKIVGIPMEEDGIDVSQLESYIKRYNPKFLYIMTNYQSPTTYSYSVIKKQKLLKLSNKYGFYIIEDDFLTDLSYELVTKIPLKSMDNMDKVIFIKSFSKIFMPGVRIGFITLPHSLFKNIIRAKHTTDISSSGFLQRAFDLYLRAGYWKGHMKKTKRVYKERYLLIIEQLERLRSLGIDFIPPKGGLSIWVKIPKNVDAIELYKEALNYNLAIVPGKVFYIDDSINTNYIRLSFGSVNNEEIKTGISILENILIKLRKDTGSNYMPFV